MVTDDIILTNYDAQEAAEDEDEEVLVTARDEQEEME